MGHGPVEVDAGSGVNSPATSPLPERTDCEREFVQVMTSLRLRAVLARAA